MEKELTPILGLVGDSYITLKVILAVCGTLVIALLLVEPASSCRFPPNPSQSGPTLVR